MYLYLALWLAALAATEPTQAQAQRSCTEYERCVPLARCGPLIRLAANKSDLSAKDSARLRESVCGWQPQGAVSQPKVCCPLLPLDECGPRNTPDKIMGGNQTVIYEFPWAARLGYRSGGALVYRCGGSLITERYVLTAAHCVWGSKPVSVRLGEHDVESDVDCSVMAGKRLCADPVVDVAVESALPHAAFVSDARKPDGLHDDVALVRLARPVAFSHSVAPICLPLRLANRPDDVNVDAESFTEYTLFVVGWGMIGADDFDDTSRYLLKLGLRAMPTNECVAKYSARRYRVDGGKQLCGIGRDGQDVCRGDSGGPLSTIGVLGGKVRSVLRGVVSLGARPCGTSGVPAIFARVTNYVPWILSNLRP